MSTLWAWRNALPSYRWALTGLTLLLSACTTPGEPTQPAASPPEVAERQAAPPVPTGAGIYRAELLATEFAADPAAHGQALMWLNEDGTMLRYRLTVGRLEPATSAHLHLTAAAGSRQSVPHYGQQLRPEDAHGPLVATLMEFTRAGVAADGLLVKGEITDTDLVGPLKGLPLTMLVEYLERGEAYVTVHIRQRRSSGQSFCCPDGLRGRIAGEGD